MEHDVVDEGDCGELVDPTAAVGHGRPGTV